MIKIYTKFKFYNINYMCSFNKLSFVLKMLA